MTLLFCVILNGHDKEETLDMYRFPGSDPKQYKRGGYHYRTDYGVSGEPGYKGNKVFMLWSLDSITL